MVERASVRCRGDPRIGSSRGLGRTFGGRAHSGRRWRCSEAIVAVVEISRTRTGPGVATRRRVPRCRRPRWRPRGGGVPSSRVAVRPGPRGTPNALPRTTSGKIRRREVAARVRPATSRISRRPIRVSSLRCFAKRRPWSHRPWPRTCPPPRSGPSCSNSLRRALATSERSIPTCRSINSPSTRWPLLGIVGDLAERLDLEIDTTLLLEHPSIERLSSHLGDASRATVEWSGVGDGFGRRRARSSRNLVGTGGSTPKRLASVLVSGCRRPAEKVARSVPSSAAFSVEPRLQGHEEGVESMRRCDGFGIDAKDGR